MKDVVVYVNAKKKRMILFSVNACGRDENEIGTKEIYKDEEIK